MAAVIGLNGQPETFAIVHSVSVKDDQHSEGILRVNKVANPNDSRDVVKVCTVTDDSSRKLGDEIPDPGYVIKASSDGMIFLINVCKKESIGKPSSVKHRTHGSHNGLSWTIPHTLLERIVGSHRKPPCRVFDLSVHPDACRMAETNNRFKNTLNELAVKAVATEFNVHLNVRKLQFPKMFKGSQVIDHQVSVPPLQDSSEALKEVSNEMTPSCYEQQNTEILVDSSKSEMPGKDKSQEQSRAVLNVDADSNNNHFTVPKYSVKFAANEEVPVVNGVKFSQTLLVDIELPLVNSALAVILDVFKKSLKLTSTGIVQYKLEIDLPCVIDESCSFAKFVKSRKMLHITMPVLTSSSTLPVESNFLSDRGKILGSESNMDADYLSSSDIAEVTSFGENTDLDKSGKDEHATDEAVSCLANVESGILHLSHRQDFETVTFLFSLKCVVPGSVSVSFISDTMCKIEMDKAVDDSGDLSCMCWFLKFDENCKCKDGSCTVDVTKENVVLVFSKASQCHHIWDTFWTGPGIDHLEVRCCMYLIILLYLLTGM